MAAPSNKPSPTNRPVEGVETTNGNEAAVTSAAAKPEAASASASTSTLPAAKGPSNTPTYQSVESSDIYLLAKRHLSDGKFEEAMSIIEEGIQGTQQLLKEISNDPDGDFTLHESMAPFHYLYGTTLLYSIEESDQEVTTAGSAVSAAVVTGNDQGANSGVAAAANSEGQQPEDDGNGTQTAEDTAEDMQIAWENLETARQIMEQMLVSDNNTKIVEKLELDLAQIYLREGDLQRMNGRYEAAIQDYQSCLGLRQKSKFLGTSDRKIADVHYNLGLVYITLASKDEEHDSDDNGVAKGKTTEDESIKEIKRTMARNKSVYHFLECSKCFCGQIASICNADAQSINNIAPDDDDNVANAKQHALPAYKTTGEEDDEVELPKVASNKLMTMRKRATELSSSAKLTPEQNLDVEDMLQLLDEIQETVDEAENSTRGVQEISNMKAAVAALAAADGEPEQTMAADGSTTTIGFSAAASASGTTTIGFGDASTSTGVATNAATGAGARPMMVIKKKKRTADTAKEPAAKMPKPESE